jgi:TonB family protein
MYLQHYSLREEPFGVTPDPRHLFLGHMHAEALASLIYGLECSRGFLALIAPPGTGKTTLLFRLLERFRNVAQTAFIFHTKCNSDDFIQFLMSDLGIDTTRHDLVHIHRLFNELVVHNASNGKRTIILIDEAQNLDLDVLETVRMLSNFETPQSKLLQIVIAGQTGLADKLGRYELRQLRQRLATIVHLRPLGTTEAGEYIDYRLKTAGYSGPSLFTPKARELLIEQSEGIPRKINILCFNALSIGFALRSKMVDEAMVQEVLDDISLRDFSEEFPIASYEGREQLTRESNSPASPHSRSHTPPRPAICHPFPIEQSAQQMAFRPPASPKPAYASVPLVSGSLALSETDPIGPHEKAVLDNLVDPQRLKRSLTAAPSEAAVPRPQHRGKKRYFRAFTVSLSLFVILSSDWYFTNSNESSPMTPSENKPANPGGHQSGVMTPEVDGPAIAPNRARRHGSDRFPLKKPSIRPVVASDDITSLISETAHTSKPATAAEQDPGSSKMQESPLLVPHSSSISSSESHHAERSPAEVVFSSSPSEVRDSTLFQLVTSAELLRSTIPEYPADAKKHNLEGTVVLLATIGKDGAVERIERISGNALLAGAASRSVRSWQYRPASVNGKPVEARARIVLNFTLRSKS